MSSFLTTFLSPAGKVDNKRKVPSELPALTGLRFFAALAIVFYHVPYVLPLSVGKTILPYGSIGVNFFFVLSGFILMHVYSGTSFETRSFYEKRAARILPLHWLTLIVWCLLNLSSWQVPLVDKVNSGITNLFLIQAFFSGLVFNIGFNAVSWSISVEAFFYLVFPWLRKNNRALNVFAAYVVIYIFLDNRIGNHIDHYFPSFTGFNPLARLIEFSGGMALYNFYKKTAVSFSYASFLQLGAIAALIDSLFALYFAETHHIVNYRWNLEFFPALALMVFSFSYDGFLSRIVASKPFIILGNSSFALYMTHHMFLGRLDTPLLRLHLHPAINLAIAVSAAIALSVAVEYVVDRPLRYFFLKQMTGQRPVIKAV